jgi:hypothetical protein
MPKASTKEEAKWPLDANTAYKSKLLEVAVRHKEGGISQRTGRAFDPFDKWLWKFEVIEGEKAGQWAWIETDDELTTLETKPVNFLTRALLQMDEVPLGFDLDTDDLIGLECYISVANPSYNKADGTTGYRTPITGASSIADEPLGIASSGGDPWAGGGDEPPF